MSAQISQLSVVYSQEEDRMLLRLGFGKQEASFWLTRRFVKAMLPALGDANRFFVPDPASPPVLQQQVIEFQRQASLSAADFKTPYDGQRDPVWKEGPVLATELVIKKNGQGLPVYLLRNMAGVGVELVMDQKLHVGFVELLHQALAKSGWDIGVPEASPAIDGERPAVH